MAETQPTREQIFQIYCDDPNAGDWHRPQENYEAGYRKGLKDAQKPCTTCGGAVSVHSPDGQYLGECPFCSEVGKLRSQLKEAINRINDMLVGDDGQAHKEARKFVEMHQQDLASKGVSDV